MNINPKTILAYLMVAVVTVTVFSFLTYALSKSLVNADGNRQEVSACECSDSNNLSALELIDLVRERDKRIDSKLDSTSHNNLLKELANAGYGYFYLDESHERQFRLNKLVIKKKDQSPEAVNAKAESDITTVRLPHEVVRRLPTDIIDSIPPEMVENLPERRTIEIEGDLELDEEAGELVGTEASDLVEKVKEYQVEPKKENVVEKIVKSPFRFLDKLFGSKNND